VIGNDAGWTQIARDQVTMLDDDVATVLKYSDYHKIADALDAKGLLLDSPADVDNVINEAKTLSHQGKPVLINALMGKTDFRKGSVSV
jgi:acetolactate synthase-1/2/3 large subunit